MGLIEKAIQIGKTELRISRKELRKVCDVLINQQDCSLPTYKCYSKSYTHEVQIFRF